MCGESGEVTLEMGKGRVVRREGRWRERGCEDEHTRMVVDGRGWDRMDRGDNTCMMSQYYITFYIP